MTHLLDTDHVSILQQEGAEAAVVSAHVAGAGQESVGVSVVSFHEQVLGCHGKLNQARTPRAMTRWYRLMGELFDLYTEFNLAPFDDAAAGVLTALNAQNIQIKAMDLRIAAVALANGLVLVTRNASDFGKVPGLRTEDWTK